MTKILQSKTVFPEYRYSQGTVEDFLLGHWPEKEALVKKFSKSVQVDGRNLGLSLKELGDLGSFAQRNRVWKELAVPLAERSIKGVLEQTGIEADEIDFFITTSITGFSVPSLDALLMNRIEFKPTMKRLPLFGFGCLGGVASLNRAHDYLKANPTHTVLVNATEFCSLTFQSGNMTKANLVGTLLFGDGAASVLLVGDEHRLAKEAQYEMIDYEAFFYKDTEDTMGWNIVDSGFELILNKNVASVIEGHIPENLGYLLDKNGLKSQDVSFSISHPGGPKVLEAIQHSLGLKKSCFQNSWDSLREHGNLSSVSVLNVLERSIQNPLGSKGQVGLMAAMGPGFNAEMTLVRRV